VKRGSGHKVSFVETHGVLMIASNDPMWPAPANVFVTRDRHGFSVVDVGCGGLSGPDHLMAGLAHWGLDLKGLHTVVLSHAHPDHMGAMGWLLEEVQPRVLVHRLDLESALDPARLNLSFDIPLVKERCAQAGKGEEVASLEILRFFLASGCEMSAAREVLPLSDEEVIRLGDLDFRVIHTPGHAPGHISLFAKERGLLLAGDLVGKFPAWYTPSSGGLLAYLESLERLQVTNAATILPAHGPPISDSSAGIEKIRTSLLRREKTMVDALGRGPKTFWQLCELLFENPLFRFFPGCGIVESHLAKLEKEGRIRRDDKMVIITR
jgi:glyoxylase-like metal-dependent hydrolase (beta-lactamase superfamily II)